MISNASQDLRDSLRTQPARFGLSFLAISIGMAAFALLLSVLGGLEERAARLASELGVRVLAVVEQKEAGKKEAVALHDLHAEILSRQFPRCQLSSTRHFTVTSGGTGNRLSLVATDEALADVRTWSLRDGRWLDAHDLALRERHAVITTALAQAENVNVGDVLPVGTLPFRIVGVVDLSAGAVEHESAHLLTPGEHALFVPKTLAPLWDASRKEPAQGFHALFLKIPDALSFDKTVRVAKQLMAFPGANADRLSWITPENLVEGLRRWRKTLQLTAGSIALLCLVLGGTTLMSLMVANVRERISEIGLRRALGATPRDIAALFVMEGCAVSAAAALVASAAVTLFVAVTRHRLPFPAEVSLANFLLPILVAVLLGFAFSLWPARLAARITPAEALRNE